MSFNTRRIHAAAARLGLTIVKLEWEPICRGLEMCGPAGGWSAWLYEDGKVACGYTTQQCIEDLERVARDLVKDRRPR